ncbi:hypothetical protein J2Y88_002027 [Pseudomonas chlororaphis]|uniref:hypothetical protein n=1 Tax=Pseudomonas chlororaphis TaxID=587753 RepID=UPI0020A1CD09|nr:hypothetical protein [Pseudomonas chlororaphis]MCP1479716.1 hypothetical protein [Pseudomonas chlororaphis]MCP1593932.1 hypothetical protein [Pseudomonas chlororaphis]
MIVRSLFRPLEPSASGIATRESPTGCAVAHHPPRPITGLDELSLKFGKEARLCEIYTAVEMPANAQDLAIRARFEELTRLLPQRYGAPSPAIDQAADDEREQVLMSHWLASQGASLESAREAVLTVEQTLCRPHQCQPVHFRSRVRTVPAGAKSGIDQRLLNGAGLGQGSMTKVEERYLMRGAACDIGSFKPDMLDRRFFAGNT